MNGSFHPRLPDPVDVAPEMTFADFYKRRLWQHHYDNYRGVNIQKLPEDLRVYQHIIDMARPELVLELGAGAGGSGLWFMDQLQTFCGGGTVVSVSDYRPEFVADGVTFVLGDLTTDGVAKEVHRLCSGKRVFISEDSAHTERSTSMALALYSDLVASDSWFVVEDGIIEDERYSIWGPGGCVQPAIRAFLETPAGQRFEQHDLPIYGVSMHRNGWLRAR